MKESILRNISLFIFVIFASVTTLATQNQIVVEQDNGASVDMNSLAVSDPWIRKSMPPNNNSAAYMKIRNTSNKDIKIIGASASIIANNVELHKSYVDEKGVSRMVSLDLIVVPANTEIELEPGSLHIMLCDLKKNLNPGDKVNLEIKIEGSDKPLVVKAEIR